MAIRKQKYTLFDVGDIVKNGSELYRITEVFFGEHSGAHPQEVRIRKVSTNELIGTYNGNHFELIERALPDKPIKFSQYDTKNMHLKDIIAKYELLKEKGLLIDE